LNFRRRGWNSECIKVPGSLRNKFAEVGIGYAFGMRLGNEMEDMTRVTTMIGSQ
jgi:hypothetical protein